MLVEPHADHQRERIHPLGVSHRAEPSTDHSAMSLSTVTRPLAVSAQDARSLGAEGYLHPYPLVLRELPRRQMTRPGRRTGCPLRAAGCGGPSDAELGHVQTLPHPCRPGG
ncbi:hypothetical protein DQ241_05655 [Blastococcus sp. TF02A-30]|nr:hypothetical protein DQ241_05655 [Blastococcus sp. TF02A-30]